MSIRNMTVQYIGSMLRTPPLEREVKRVEVGGIVFVPERTCKRVTLGLEREREIATVSWICSACGKHMSRDDNYCPNCGAKVVEQ